jgi:hypothetical protein
MINCGYCDGTGTLECQGTSDNMDIYLIDCEYCNGTGKVHDSIRHEFEFSIEKNIQVSINEFTERMIKMANADKYNRNKFYIGSNSVFDRNWGHRTLNEAINHAKVIMDNDNKDEIFIVKIVKVVRRKSAPIEVVDVK